VLRRHPYATIASSLGMLRDEFLFWLRHVHLLAGGDPLHDGITATLVPVRSSASIPVGRGRRHTVPWDPVSLPALEIQKESPAARQHEPRLVDLPTGDGNVKARLRAASKAPVPPRADPWSRHHPEWSAWVRTAVTDLLDRRSSLELIRRIESMDPLLLIQWAQGPLGKEMDACTILSPPESAHGHVAQQPPRTPPT
jgi:hypothetical protein